LIDAARGSGLRGPRPRQWLACRARAGLARPPIPQGGLGFPQPIVGDALAPPAALVGGTARHKARPEPSQPGPPHSSALAFPRIG